MPVVVVAVAVEAAQARAAVAVVKYRDIFTELQNEAL